MTTPYASARDEMLALIKRRPKIALRGTSDRRLQLAIKSYDLNRHTQAEAKAFEYVRELLLRQQ